MALCIRSPCRNLNSSDEIRVERMYFNLRAISFVIIIYMLLHKEMGLNCLKVEGLSILGIRVMKVEL
jgi:hypothetical protein